MIYMYINIYGNKGALRKQTLCSINGHFIPLCGAVEASFQPE